MPGLTALRLKLVGSKSSSLLRLLLTLRVISAAVGTATGCGVVDLDGDDVCGSELVVCWLGNTGGVESKGESRDTSSLIPDDDPRGRNAGGGVRVFSSVKVSQNSLPFEFRIACCLKLLERPVVASDIISSSAMPSNESCVIGPRLGEECVVVVVDMEGRRVGSSSISLSRVRRITSASRRTSVSIGALSSARAARIRAKPLVLGYMISVNMQ
jgi:hypothetical protein